MERIAVLRGYPDIVVFDTETTGLGADARIVEIAAVLLRDGRVVDEFQSLVNPGIRIPESATRIHGIDNPMVRDAPPTSVALRAFGRFVERRPLAAHNAAFDRRMLAQDLARCGLRVPGGALYCTCRIARRVFPSASSHRLTSLAAMLEIRANAAHRALSDARLAASVLDACVVRSGTSLDRIHGAPVTWQCFCARGAWRAAGHLCPEPPDPDAAVRSPSRTASIRSNARSTAHRGTPEQEHAMVAAKGSHDVRRRLEQFVANPRCDANVIAAVHDVDMVAVAASEGVAAREGQSGFAIARGKTFEHQLYKDSAAALREDLARARVLPVVDVPVHDLRIRMDGGPRADLTDATATFGDLLTTGLSDAALVIAPAMQLPGNGFVPDGRFAIDVLTAHPDERAPGVVTLRVGEIKAYPDRGGYTDAGQLAGARAQAGLYVHVLRTTIAGLGLEKRFEVANDGFLVLANLRGGGASIRPGEDLRWQAHHAAANLERLHAAGATVAPSGATESVRSAATSYDASCVSFCPRARACRRRAEAAGDASALGPDAKRALGDVTIPRAISLLRGEAGAVDVAEHDLLRRVARARRIG